MFGGLYIFYSQIKAQWDEYMSRVESNFYKEIVPLLQDTGYSNPKMYFNGNQKCNDDNPNHLLLSTKLGIQIF